MKKVDAIVKKCVEFRKNSLKMTQKQVSEKSGISIINLQAFENGRANNIIYIHAYYNACDTIELKALFKNNIF